MISSPGSEQIHRIANIGLCLIIFKVVLNKAAYHNKWIDNKQDCCYSLIVSIFPVTPLRNALENDIKDNIESTEAEVQRLRSQARKHFEAIGPDQHDELVTVCRSIFEILNLQDRLNQERHRLSVLSR